MKYSSFLQIIEQGAKHYGSCPALRMIGPDRLVSELTYDAFSKCVKERSEQLKQEAWECGGLYGGADFAWIIDLFAAPIAGKRIVLLDHTVSREVTQNQIDEYRIEAVLPDNAGFRMVAEHIREPEYAGCILVFTSGTSASNKAVILRQEALNGAVWNGQQMIMCGPGDVIPAILPLHHVFGLVCTLLWPLSYGASVGIGRGMRYYAQDPALYHATILPVVPSILEYLLKTDGINPECHTVIVGAASCPESVRDAVRRKGIRLCEGYGLTETGSGIAISVGADDPNAMQLCPDVSVTISGEGEVLASASSMMEGYWHRPEETAEVLSDGVLHTGDFGSLDEDGKLHLLGRRNDVLILPNGEKIFCPEWEAELSALLGAETALILMDDVLTLVVGGSADEAYVTGCIDTFNRNLPISKKIRKIRITECSLPRTASGKLQRWKVEKLL